MNIIVIDFSDTDVTIWGIRTYLFITVEGYI